MVLCYGYSRKLILGQCTQPEWKVFEVFFFSYHLAFIFLTKVSKIVATCSSLSLCNMISMQWYPIHGKQLITLPKYLVPKEHYPRLTSNLLQDGVITESQKPISQFTQVSYFRVMNNMIISVNPVSIVTVHFLCAIP